MFRTAMTNVRRYGYRRPVPRCLLALLACSFWMGNPVLASTAPANGVGQAERIGPTDKLGQIDKVKQTETVREAKDAPGRPRPRQTYKFVFEMNTSEDTTLGYNPGLRALGDLITEYDSYGVDAGHRSIVVVVNGTHAEMALTDASYRRVHGGQENPSIRQIQALERLGVVFTVPARDVTAMSLAVTDIQPGIKVGPRASIVYLDLEAMGYVFSGVKSLITE